MRREFAEMSEVVNLAAMSGREAQVRQYISDLQLHKTARRHPPVIPGHGVSNPS